MKKVNLWLYRLKTWILMNYFKKEIEERIKKIDPIHLLAIKNGLMLKSIIKEKCVSEDFCFPAFNVYVDSCENEYVPIKLGFVSIEVYNTILKLRGSQKKYSNLLNDYGKLKEEFLREEKLYNSMQLRNTNLNASLENLRNRVKILEKENK